MKEKSKEENMKALSIEEKAKRFDKMIERARKVLLDCTPEEQHVVEYIFPQIRESKDEKIRREILSFLREGKPYHCPDSVKRQEWASWIEKQGDITKLSEEEQNRFAKGVLSSCAMSFIDYLDAHNYEGKMCVSNGECADIENAFHNSMWDRLHRYYCKYIEKQNEQKPADKIEPKFHEGEWITIKE